MHSSIQEPEPLRDHFCPAFGRNCSIHLSLCSHVKHAFATDSSFPSRLSSDTVLHGYRRTPPVTTLGRPPQSTTAHHIHFPTTLTRWGPVESYNTTPVRAYFYILLKRRLLFNLVDHNQVLRPFLSLATTTKKHRQSWRSSFFFTRPVSRLSQCLPHLQIKGVRWLFLFSRSSGRTTEKSQSCQQLQTYA